MYIMHATVAFCARFPAPHQLRGGVAVVGPTVLQQIASDCHLLLEH
jgi:hypothetical protein